MTRVKALLAALLTALPYLAACSDSATEEGLDAASTTPTSTVAISEADFIAAIKSLPIFPGAQLANGQGIEGQYPTNEPFAPNLTGFYVTPGTVTVDEVTSFFALELPKLGWKEERAPWTYGAEKEGSGVRTIVCPFIYPDKALRLSIEIPLIHKDLPDGVRAVSLNLWPIGTDPFASPVSTGIDSTPPPTEPATSPADPPSGTEKPVIETNPAPTRT